MIRTSKPFVLAARKEVLDSQARGLEPLLMHCIPEDAGRSGVRAYITAKCRSHHLREFSLKCTSPDLVVDRVHTGTKLAYQDLQTP